MLFSTTCKQGKLQLTEDGYAEVASMVSGQSWREPVSAIRGISFKPGLMASCGFIVFAEEAHLVTMVVRKHFDQFCALLPHIQVTQVPELYLPPPAQPLPPTPYPYPEPYPLAEVAPPPPIFYPEPYPSAEITLPPPPAPVTPTYPALDIPCKGNRLQLTESGYLQQVRPFGSIVWSVLARQVTGIRSQKKFPALTVTIDTPGGSYIAEMVSNQDFEKLRAAIAAYQ